ncbi:MAG TPA: hypothetical protein VHZ73_01675 [Vicinamibacterales bacterium]|jgi:hypothetical protein|nr:hypothetical protein [Vicinamibacterales bacterium]
MRRLFVLLVASLILLPAASFADDGQHAVAPSTLAGTVASHAAEQDANRAAIRAALARPEVKDVAEKAGVDLDHANAVVDTLDGSALDHAASVARQVSQQLAGGDSTVIISTTTVIIILLLVLLIVVAVK